MNGPPQAITLTRLRELWLHTGTACNLSCPFCHEGSKPGDQRLQALTLEEIRPLLLQAAAQGVERFAFTGGEPLILRDIQAILSFALQLRPVLVLTNGTAPFIRRAHQLEILRSQLYPLTFRVSIDFPDEAQHDAGRGLKNFRKALEGLRLLHTAGFAVGITRQQQQGEDPISIEGRFRNLLRKQRLPEDLPIVALPPLGPLEATVATLLPTASDNESRMDFALPPACSRSRMVIRRAGSVQLVPCPLVDNDPKFDMPADLELSCRTPISAVHPRCSLCRSTGVGYAGIN